MIGLDHGDNAIDVQGTERLFHNRTSRLGGQPTSPGVRVQVVAKLYLGTLMFERLKATVADHAVRLPVFDGPEAPPQGGLVLELQRDFALDILPRVSADPPLDLWMQVDVGQWIEIVTAQRAQT